MIGTHLKRLPHFGLVASACLVDKAARHHLSTTPGRPCPTNIVAEGGEGALHSPNSGGALLITKIAHQDRTVSSRGAPLSPP